MIPPIDALEMLRDIPSPILVFEADALSIRWVNDICENWLGQSAKSLCRSQWSDHFDGTDDIARAVARCQRDKAPVSLRGYILSRVGHPDQRAHLTVFPSSQTDGTVGMIVALSAAQPSETPDNGFAVSAMGRMLAHEIKNPLAGIDGAAQLLRHDIDTEEGQKLIDLIRSEISRIRRLAERMETLGDRDPKTLGLVNIHEILRDARKLMQSSVSSDIVFTERYDPSLPDTMGDRDTLMQAVLNLIKNAVEAIEIKCENGDTHTGIITLSTTFRSGVTRKNLSGRPDKGLPIEISISDNGPGIPDTIREQIFQPFVTHKPTGQGLGLALVAKVASAHDGLIEVKSRPGKTVFSLLLPMLHDTGDRDEI